MTRKLEQDTRSLSVRLAAFGGRIEAYRLARGLRQADLAEVAGISRSTLHRMESGKGGTVENLLRVLDALGLAERLDGLVPDATRSPLDPRSARAPRRQRAPSPRRTEEDPGQWSWTE